MGLFGWSYPAGCDGPPDEAYESCEVCGLDIESCECPECPICGMRGNPGCYDESGALFSVVYVITTDFVTCG